MYAFPPPNIIWLVLRRQVKGRPDNGNSISARPNLISKYNVASKRATEMCLALRMASVEYNNKGSNPEGHENIKLKPGVFHLYLHEEWYCRGNCRDSHWLMDKEYQTKLLMAAWTVVYFLPLEQVTNAWSSCEQFCWILSLLQVI